MSNDFHDGHLFLDQDGYQAGRIFTQDRRRPSYNIPREQLELVEHRFNTSDMAIMLGVSVRTVQRRLSEYSISITERFERYADILNEVLVTMSRKCSKCSQIVVTAECLRTWKREGCVYKRRESEILCTGLILKEYF